MAKKKELSWDEIGKAIGKKIERVEKEDKPWGKAWMYHHESGGGFGRFLFIVGVLYALSIMGVLEGIPLWTVILIVIGFSAMKF